MLENLNQLALEARQKSTGYNKKEFVFSNKFKSKFKELLPDFNIEFYDYTSVVKTPTDLLILIPNQWFVIASFFNGYMTALKNYKNCVNELKIDKTTINVIRESKTIDDVTDRKIETKFHDANDIENFKKFLSNYEWWFGSKTIDRADYFVSSVLNLAGVVNNTQSYIADLAYLLSDHKDLIEILQEDYDNFLSKPINRQNVDETIIYENKILRQIIFDAFKYIIKEFGEEKVLNNYDLKETKIENRDYKGLSLDKYFGFETLIGFFETEQNSESLKSSGTPRFLNEKINILNNQFSYFTSQWNSVENGRGLSLINFNLLLKDISNSKLKIIKEDNVYQLICRNLSPLRSTTNIIFYGAPGTGKSYKVEQILKPIDSQFYERITFHPEFDNASFVGGYRPVSQEFTCLDSKNEEYTEHEVCYKFVPQAFANIYVKAWNDLDNQYYLAIEEINRGNCAEIFGDVFQLLDRKSNYTVSASNELKEHLNKVLHNKDGIRSGLKLPPNLSILATMNTSDQSLFPMDSAFKRRWDWEYIPICYDDIPENESFEYKVKIDGITSFKWIDFIKNVNAVIKSNLNLGMDKCIGNYFIKSDSKEITLNEFVNKAVFYLWNDVFKDEDSSDSIFEKGVSYEDFFPIDTKGKEEIEKILKKLEIGLTVTGATI